MIAPVRHLRNPHPLARWCRATTAFALSLALPALSAAQTPAASEVNPATVAATPVAEAPVESAAIVLVLPLASATFGRAAEAVQAGFLAAADAAKARVVVIAHADGEVLAAFGKAKDAGARVIVGPLVRDDLKIVAGAGLKLPPTIALNQLDEGTMLPESIYSLTLTLDSDARQLARRARDEGAMTVAVIASDTPLQQRFAGAFNAEWILAGGSAPVMFRFDRAPEVLRTLRRDLIKTPFDAALLAIDGADAALAKSYVKSIPTYTSSQVNEHHQRNAPRDLDDVRFVDIPWLVDPDAAAFAGLKRPDYPNAALDRLYALGIDAFRIAQAFAEGAPGKLDFDGATGRLSLDATRQFTREGRLMLFRSGQIVPAGTR
jgi:outer membrane PBP1 activator LpoA protein